MAQKSMPMMDNHAHGIELGLEERNKTYARFINLLKYGSAGVIIVLVLLFLFTR